MSATETTENKEIGPLLGLGSSAGLGRGAEIARLVEYLKSGGMHDGIDAAIRLLLEQEAEIERLRAKLGQRIIPMIEAAVSVAVAAERARIAASLRRSGATLPAPDGCAVDRW